MRHDNLITMVTGQSIAPHWRHWALTILFLTLEQNVSQNHSHLQMSRNSKFQVILGGEPRGGSRLGKMDPPWHCPCSCLRQWWPERPEVDIPGSNPIQMDNTKPKWPQNWWQQQWKRNQRLVSLYLYLPLPLIILNTKIIIDSPFNHQSFTIFYQQQKITNTINNSP